MTASPRQRPRYPFSAIAVFGGGAVALAVLGWNLFALARSHLDGLPDVSAEADSAPAGPPANATLFDSVASVADADMHEGVWFLLDKRLSRVHRISDGNNQWSAFARPGDGPGELRRPAALAVHGDTIVVAAPRRLQFYWPDGTYIGGRDVEPPSICRDTRLGDLAARLSDVSGSSIRIRVPERYPPFDRVFVRSDGALFYRTPVSTVPPGSAEVEMAYRLAKYDGSDWTTTPIPSATTLFVSDRAVLAAWDDVHGTLIAFYSLDGGEV